MWSSLLQTNERDCETKGLTLTSNKTKLNWRALALEPTAYESPAYGRLPEWRLKCLITNHVYNAITYKDDFCTLD